jgi:hypothetical protein
VAGCRAHDHEHARDEAEHAISQSTANSGG